MRLIRFAAFLALCASGSHSTAAAQTAPATTTPAAATPANPATCNCANMNVRRLLPYSYKQTTTRVQTLADGSTITNVTVALIARDADGRTRNETFRSQPNGNQFHTINVNDPILGVSFNWTVNPASDAQKVVTVFHRRQNLQPPPQTPNPPNRRYYPYKNESLPPQTIQGLYAEGSRSARTTPAGYENNDHDLITVTESWFSPDLGIQLRVVTDDPRNGKTTIETTDLQQAAPDPSLFKLPDGYQIRDQNP